MFVRDPELLVFDDLSSALDVETEQILWQRLFGGSVATVGAVRGDSVVGAVREDSAVGALREAPLRATDSDRNTPTCLVVSHRRPALRRADQILVLREGRIVDRGTLAELLARCEEMRRLWRGDLGAAEPEETWT